MKQRNSDKKLIYIAGALNGKDAVDYIQNLHRMIKCEDTIRQLGFVTFCPGYDFLGGLLAGNWEYKDYFENNQPILARCDGVFLVPGWENSKGTKKEIETAKKLGIPVFENQCDLKNYFELPPQKSDALFVIHYPPIMCHYDVSLNKREDL